jgi:tyrosinase
MATGSPSARTAARPLRYRRKVQNLKAGQLALLREAFQAVMRITDDRGYARWAGVHGLPLPVGCDFAHRSPFFLPWHRAYLYRFERALRDQVPNAMLPWWDWRTPSEQQGRIPAGYAEERADGRDNPLFSAEVSELALRQGRDRGVDVPPRTRRSPSSQRALRLPTPEQINTVLQIESFDRFTSILDGIHGGVHMWVGGHMTNIDFAAFDPIFWAHHGMVDRIWRMWQIRHGRAGPPESIWDRALEPFGMTVRDTLSVTRLGYDYARATDSKRR